MAKELVSDRLWEVVEPLLSPEPDKTDGGRPRVNDRATLTGIILAGTYNAEVSDNVLAYDNSGIVVVNTAQEKGFDTVKNVILSSNDVIQENGPAVAWMKSYPGGYDTASGNGCQDNRYYYPETPDGESR